MKKQTLAVMSALIFSSVGVVNAGEAYSTLNVSATAVASCSVSVEPLAFGDYDGSSDLLNNGAVEVTCASGVTYHIALNSGSNAGPGEYRVMVDGGGTNGLSYILYQDAAYTTEWGDNFWEGSYSQGEALEGLGDGTLQTHTVYGYLASSQPIVAGAYNDIVTVSVYY